MASGFPQPEIKDQSRPRGSSGKKGGVRGRLLYFPRRTTSTFVRPLALLCCALLIVAFSMLFAAPFSLAEHPQAELMLAVFAGIALGAMGLWLAMRAHFARSLAHVEDFRRRLMSVERDQALWISLSAVLHDVRNPLHNVTLLAETLGSPGANVMRVREQILGELDRINVRLRKVRAQVAEFSGDIERRTIPLRTVLDEVDDMIAPLARRSGVAFAFHCAPHLKVVADPKFLVQAVDHLLLNSLQILTEQPPERPRRLSVSVQLEADCVALLIDDTGPGLPESVRTAPFEPMGGSQRGGLGLGLTIAHALARAAGGELSVARTDASGTRFRLQLVAAT